MNTSKVAVGDVVVLEDALEGAYRILDQPLDVLKDAGNGTFAQHVNFSSFIETKDFGDMIP